MTLLERIAALPEITPQEVRKEFTFEDFRFEIMNKVNGSEPNYDNLLSIFHEVQKFLEIPVYNIINERIAFKALYLNLGYEMDIDMINSLMCVLPLVKLDFELGKLLKSEFYDYLENSYWQYRQNIQVGLAEIVTEMKNINLDGLVEEMKGGVEKLEQFKNN